MSDIQTTLANIREVVRGLGEDVRVNDIFYDSRSWEPDYPKDGFTPIIQRVKLAPDILAKLLDELETEISKGEQK